MTCGRCIVCRWLGGWSLWCSVAPGHAAIDNEISTIDEAALVAGKEKDSLGLLNGLTEPAGGEVNFTAMSLGSVITEPVLEEWRARTM